MQAPDLADLKQWSKVDWDELDFGVDDQLQTLLDRAIKYVCAVTGRTFDDDPSIGAEIPDPLIETGNEAVQMRAEQLGFQGQEDYIETGSDDEIQSFSAGSYSETRKTPTRLTRGGSEAGLLPVNQWDALNQRLWLLMTPEMEDFWREKFGQMPPSFATTEVDWEASDMYPPITIGPPWYGNG